MCLRLPHMHNVTILLLECTSCECHLKSPRRVFTLCVHICHFLERIVATSDTSVRCAEVSSKALRPPLPGNTYVGLYLSGDRSEGTMQWMHLPLCPNPATCRECRSDSVGYQPSLIYGQALQHACGGICGRVVIVRVSAQMLATQGGRGGREGNQQSGRKPREA